MPTSIGRFRVESALGGGSFGTVYRAHDPLIGELVAIKVLRPELGRDGEQMERLRREVVLARKVDHPNVCRIHDLQQDGETLYVVMELVDGETLDNVCARGALPAVRAVRIIEHVCQALAAAHAVGVLHRDIKPSNVMVRSKPDDDDVKLVDFGIATTHGLDHLTQPGVALGTVGYLAPELWEGEAATPKSDVFAAGVMLYGALTGRLPWRASGLALAQQMRSVPAAAPSIFVNAIDAALDAIVMQAIALRPADRFASARAFADALHAWRARSPAEDSRPSSQPAIDEVTGEVRDTTPMRTAPPRSALAIAGGLVALAAVAAWFVLAPVPRDPAALEVALDAAALDGAEREFAHLGVVALDVTDVEVAAPESADAARVREGNDDKRAASAERSLKLRNELRRLLDKRGLVAGDVATVDAALRLKLRDSNAPAALERALADANGIAVDRAFVERKLARLQSRAGASSSKQLDALAGGIAADISARRYIEANGRLNRALALVR